MSRRAALPLAVALLAAGCTSSTTGTAAPASSSAAPSTDAGGCPRERNEPDPDRPVVDLDFSLAEDLRTVTGTETVVFTPDLPTDELVFRLVPNGPDTTAAGNQLTVDAVRAGQHVARQPVNGLRRPGRGRRSRQVCECTGGCSWGS